MPQFFIQPAQIHGKTAILTGEEAHHLTRALRYREGDHVWFSDGRSTQYEGKILSATPHQVTLEILQRREILAKVQPPAMAMAILKQERWDMALQKVVELGCSTIFPFISSRTIPHYEQEDIPKKVNRWQKIALEAAKQSGLPVIPQVSTPLDWTRLLQQFSNFETVLLPWEGEQIQTLHEVTQKKLGRALIVIGPEGGFSPEEAGEAKASGAQLVTLGSQILRAETASIVTFTLVQFVLGNI